MYFGMLPKAYKLAIAVDGAVVKHLNAPQNTAQLTGLLSWANITSKKKKINGLELSCESSDFYK